MLVFANVAPGRYTLTAYHDENGNRRLDRELTGWPVERYGFSRDPNRVMGVASFADSAVELQEDTTLRITLR